MLSCLVFTPFLEVQWRTLTNKSSWFLISIFRDFISGRIYREIMIIEFNKTNKIKWISVHQSLQKNIKLKMAKVKRWANKQYSFRIWKSGKKLIMLWLISKVFENKPLRATVFLIFLALAMIQIRSDSNCKCCINT